MIRFKVFRYFKSSSHTQFRQQQCIKIFWDNHSSGEVYHTNIFGGTCTGNLKLELLLKAGQRTEQAILSEL